MKKLIKRWAKSCAYRRFFSNLVAVKSLCSNHGMHCSHAIIAKILDDSKSFSINLVNECLYCRTTLEYNY